MVQRMARTSARFKTTVYLDADELRTLQRTARELGRTTAALIREAIRLYSAQLESPRPKSIGVVRSGKRNLSKRADEILRDAMRSVR